MSDVKALDEFETRLAHLVDEYAPGAGSISRRAKELTYAEIIGALALRAHALGAEAREEQGY